MGSSHVEGVLEALHCVQVTEPSGPATVRGSASPVPTAYEKAALDGPHARLMCPRCANCWVTAFPENAVCARPNVPPCGSHPSICWQGYDRPSTVSRRQGRAVPWGPGLPDLLPRSHLYASS